MRQPIFTSARLTEAELITVLKCLKRLRKETYDEFCVYLGLPETFGGRLNNAFNGKTSGLKQLSPLIIQRLDEVYNEQLFRTIREIDDSDESLYARLIYPQVNIDQALASWVDERESQRQFNRLRTGKKGNYYILRMSSDSELVCSWMHICPSTVIHPLPRFLTVRQRKGLSGEKFVRGVIFESGGQIYSFGKAPHGFGFRAAILKPHVRHHREDMVGIRLGLQDNPDRPFGYPLYCYQIDAESRRDIRALIGKHSVSMFRNNSKLQGIDEVLDVLKNSAGTGIGGSLPE